MSIIQILGPFNSGTNLLARILRDTSHLDSDDNIFIEPVGSTIIWKHSIEYNLIRYICNMKNTIIFIMYRDPFLWINSMIKKSYDIRNFKKLNSKISFRNYKYKNIIKLYNHYYDTYMSIIKKNNNVVWIDYCKLVDKNNSYDYIQEKIKSVNLKLNSKNKLLYYLNTPAKHHGDSVKTSEVALKKCKEIELLFSKTDKDYINKYLDPEIQNFFLT